MTVLKPTERVYVNRGYPTPWGPAQVRYQYTDSVSFYSCAGHGGYKVNKTANTRIPEPLRNNDGWYEEDCESAIVHYFLLEAFDTEKINREYFRSVIVNYWPDKWTAATGETVALEESSELRKRKFSADNADNWVAIAAWGDWADWVPEGKVGVLAAKGGRRDGLSGEAKFLVDVEKYRARQGSYVVDPVADERIE